MDKKESSHLLFLTQVITMSCPIWCVLNSTSEEIDWLAQREGLGNSSLCWSKNYLWSQSYATIVPQVLLGEERVWFHFILPGSSSSLRDMRAGSQGKNCSRAMGECPLLAHLSDLLSKVFCIAQANLPKRTLHTVVALLQLAIKKMLHRLAHRPVWSRQFLSWGSPFPDVSSLFTVCKN